MANFLLRSANQRSNKRRQKRKDKESAAAGGNTATNHKSRLPTRAMIQLLKGRASSHDSDESDMSTFDTTTKHHQSKSNNKQHRDKEHAQEATRFPILRPTPSGTGLEVDFSTTPPASFDHNNNNKPKPKLQQAPPHRVSTPPQCPLSPLTIASTRDETEGQRLLEQRDSSDTKANKDNNGNLLLLPTESTFATNSTIKSKSKSKQSPPQDYNTNSIPTSTSNTSSNTNSTTTTPSLWQDLWQRCITDCYCISNTTSNTTVLDDDDDLDGSYNSTAPDYFQFLSCVEEEDLSTVVPKVCEQLQSESPKLRSKALSQLSQLCDRDHEYNRIPLVCSCDQYGDNCQVVQVVCETILLDPTVSWKQYRQALLILSNLTLPLENKAVLLLGPLGDLVLKCLYQGLRVGHYHDASSPPLVITPSQQQQQLEVHLVCAILFNLSFLNDGKAVLLKYVPQDKYDSTTPSPLDNPHSLLRVLERMMKHFQPYAHKGHDSVERQALRWTLGMMRNLVQTQDDLTIDVEAARLVGQTTIPLVALELLRDACHANTTSSPTNPEDKRHRWRPQSLEDLALGFLVELALRENEHDIQVMAQQVPGSNSNSNSNNGIRDVLVPALYPVSARKYLQPLMRVGGIHGVRAQAIVKRFDHGNHDAAMAANVDSMASF